VGREETRERRSEVEVGREETRGKEGGEKGGRGEGREPKKRNGHKNGLEILPQQHNCSGGRAIFLTYHDATEVTGLKLGDGKVNGLEQVGAQPLTK